MKRSSTQILLGLAGAMLFAIGCAILLFPHGFFASNGVTLSTDPNLMSEVRAPGGLLIASAVLILFGAFRESHTRTALTVAAAVYGCYALARLVSIAIDGLPSTSLLAATAIELVVAVLCTRTLTSTRKTTRTHPELTSLVA